MKEVKSSNLAAVGYDLDSKTLKVKFNSGDIYHYFEVPPEVHEQLLLSPSIGKYFNQFVKTRYKYGRVSP